MSARVHHGLVEESRLNYTPPTCDCVFTLLRAVRTVCM